METLDRGLIASRLETGGVYISWRVLGEEWHDVGYNLYRNDKTEPIATFSKTDPSNYIDTSGTLDHTYEVEPVYKNGTVGSRSPLARVLPNPYIEIELEPIPKIAGVPDSYYNQYTINDMTAADLTGDGQYELIVKWVNEGFNSAAPEENKYYSLFDAYKYDREQDKWVFMWRIDVGPNIFHNVEITCIAYDFDGDGKAEVVMRAAEGTKDAQGNVIGDEGNDAGFMTPDGKTNYRDRMQNNSQWFDYAGPEWLALFDGETGVLLDKTPHIPRNPTGSYKLNGDYYGDAGLSASQLAHRACKFHYAAPYLDGINPSLVVSRGIYYRTIIRAYDIVNENGNKKFSEKWEFKSDDFDGYNSQGYHASSVGDMDNDGCDEFVYGSMTVNNNGKGLYTTRLGHGDAIQVGNLDPYRKGLEVFNCLEEAPYYGTTFRAGESGEILLQKIATDDEGRCMAANVTNRFKGAEMWPSANGSFSASERREITFSGASSNFRIFWDGDLLDELTDHIMDFGLGKGIGVVQKYVDNEDLTGGYWTNLLQTDGYYSCNYTKRTPCLQADLFGDWREELIFRNEDDTKIRIYFTQIPTEHRIYTLMHDMQYRQAIAWQMVGYNQPPLVSFFLGEAEGITVPPPPLMSNNRLVYKSGNVLNSAAWTSNGNNESYADGKHLLFDFSSDAVIQAGDNNALVTVELNQTIAPDNVTVYARKNLVGGPSHDYKLNVTSGKMTGDMKLVKQGGGTFTFNGTHDYDNTTEIWDGRIVFDGELSKSAVWMYLFGELEATGTLGNGLSMNYASVVYPGGEGTVGNLTVNGDINLRENSILEFDISNSASDRITITNGKLNLSEEKAVIRLNITEDLNPGNYSLIEVAEIDGDLSKIVIDGLGSQIGSLSHTGSEIVLTIHNVRAIGDIVWTGSDSDEWNLYGDENFLLDDTKQKFITGDNVTFDESSEIKTIVITEPVAPGEIVIDSADDYTFVSEGDGKITGAASLTKRGTGKLTLTGINDFTGKISIEGGTLEVEKFPSLVNNGSIGTVSDNTDLFYVNNATITYTGDDKMQISRAMSVGNDGATIHNTSELIWYSPVAGNILTKTGRGELRIDGKNTMDTLYMNTGTLSLISDEAIPGKTVKLANGTTFKDNMSGSYHTRSTNLDIPVGASVTFNSNSAVTYSGRLTGGGELTINIPYVRSHFSGDWSGFTGKITAVDTYKHATTPSEYRLLTDHKLDNAEISLSGFIKLNVISGSGRTIGALSGTGTSQFVLGGHTWTIGNKPVDAEFAGIISGSGKIVKTGTGSWILMGVNTYTATTDINGGRVVIGSSSSNSSAKTGSGLLQ